MCACILLSDLGLNVILFKLIIFKSTLRHLLLLNMCENVIAISIFVDTNTISSVKELVLMNNKTGLYTVL